jgi:tRNA-specific 2-thiouridylase
VAARVVPHEAGRIAVELREPQYAITPGQSVVLYRGEVVIGGGVIARAA